jgi:hypothetical protein
MVGDALVRARRLFQNWVQFLLFFFCVLQEEVVDSEEPGPAFVITELTRLDPGQGLFEFTMFGRKSL